MEEQFTLDQHRQFVELLIAAAGTTKGDMLRLSLDKIAQIYDFQNLLKDPEELEFVMEDLTMELLEMDMILKDGSVIPSCGIVELDYPGEGKKVFVDINPKLRSVDVFELEAMQED